MQLTEDSNKFDQLQIVLVRELIEQIRFKLASAGISGEQLRDITGEIAFSITSTIDDTAGIEQDGVEVKPYLTFVADDDQLVHCGENSFAHEHVARIVDQVFNPKSDS